MALTDADEYLHDPPRDGHGGLWSDNFWFSVVDRDADVYGINHIHASRSHGYLRASAMYVVDGWHQQWASRQPLDVDRDFDHLGDGRLTYTVLSPFERVRWECDTPKFGFDLTFDARFPAFDYHDCPGGNPLAAFEAYGGHYEQAYHVTGEFEAYGGPRAGERRHIDSHSHRDHSWTYRFTRETPWIPRFRKSFEHMLGHVWPSVQTDTMHLNSFTWLSPEHPLPPGAPRSGGWIATAEGTRAIRSATGAARFEDDLRTAMSFDLGFELLDGTSLTVRTTRKLAQTRNGLMRAENDAEARLDCYEPFFEFEILETGERGYGVVEYSMEPATPRYRF